MTKPHYEDFKFQGPDVSDVQQVLRERQALYAPTGASSNEGEQYVRVTRTLPNKERRESAIPVVRFPAWTDDAGRSEDGIFNRLIANETGHPVYSVSAPGVDYSQWRDPEYDETHLLTPEQIEDLQKGSYRQVGGATMRAARNADAMWNGGEPRDEESYIVHASSMGVAMAAGAIRAALEDGVMLEGIVLSEDVNTAPRSLPRLGAQFGLQNRHAGNYLEQNPSSLNESNEGIRFWLGRVMEGRVANKGYVRALARGAFLNDLLPESFDRLAADEQATPVLLTRGTASHLSDEGAHADLYRRLVQRGVRTNDMQYPNHDHPYTMTAQSVIDTVRAVKRI